MRSRTGPLGPQFSGSPQSSRLDKNKSGSAERRAGEVPSLQHPRSILVCAPHCADGTESRKCETLPCF